MGASPAAALLVFLGGSLAAQQPNRADTTRADSLRPVLLAPVIVSVTRSPTDAGHVPFAVAVITREEIARGRPTQGLSEALVTVPGVFIADRHNPSQDDNLSIRGFGARSAFGVRGLKVLLDGIPQTLPDGQGQLSNVELARVSRIEVLRGPSSSLYGNASGGVISLWTDPGRPSGFEPGARATVGAYRTWKAYVGAAAPLPGGVLSADGSTWATDGFRDHSAGETRRGSLRYGADLSQTRLVAQVLVADSPRLEDPGALTESEADTAPTLANPRNVTFDVGKRVSQEQAGLALEHRAKSGRSFNLAVFALKRDLENPIATTYIQLDRWAYGTRAGATQPLTIGSRAALVTVGVDAQWQHDDRVNQNVARTATTRDQLERVSEIGPFLEARADLARRVTLTLGGRYDRVAFRVDDRLLSDGNDSGSRVMAAPSGSAGLTVDLGRALQPYASVSTSFETPTTTELGNRPTGPGGFNPDLEPQHALNVELGARGRLSGIVGYSLSAYQAQVRDELIPFEVPGDPGRRFFQNAGSARHRGLEAGMALQPVPTMTLVAAYTLAVFRFQEFRTATDTLDGNDIPGVPRHYGHVSLRYQGPRGFWGAVDATASSGLFVNDLNTVRTDGWRTLGLRIGWEGRLGSYRVSPFAAVQNALDERYIGSVSVNAQFGRFFEPAPGRNGYVGLEIRGF
jgi:iron complex outermembrane receptor protein